MATFAAAGGSAFRDDAARMQRRIGVGIALSLALHALVLNLQRIDARRDVDAAPRPIAVRLRPPPPPLPRIEETPAPPVKPAPRAPRRAPPKAPRPVIAVDPAPTPAASDRFTVQQAPQAEPEAAPRFDVEAARKMARSLANIRDPAKEGTAIGQFPDKPLETETRAARAIGAAKRRNCKDGIPGGLLAPLLLLADKKDSGCKW